MFLGRETLMLRHDEEITFYEAVPTIIKVIAKLGRNKGCDMDNKRMTINKWAVFCLIMLKHIEEAQRGK